MGFMEGHRLTRRSSTRNSAGNSFVANQPLSVVGQVDINGDEATHLKIDTIPDYTAPAPTPAVGQSALWKYKIIYRKGDDRVGQMERYRTGDGEAMKII